MFTTPKIVCFDWGGVILRHCRSWAEGCQRIGLDVRIDLACEKGLARRREITSLHQRGQISHDEYLNELAQATGHAYTPHELRQLHHGWLMDEYEGVAPILKRLNQNEGVTTALLSNTNEAHWARHLPGPTGTPPDYPTAGLLKLRYASHLLGLAKPDPAIYREFEKLVDARAEQILFFDDLEENVRSAQSLGWQVVLVDHTTCTATQIDAALRQRDL